MIVKVSLPVSEITTLALAAAPESVLRLMVAAGTGTEP